jgi:GDP-4-dehydro-6-deoxy-D-mannose reductase
MRALVTGGGGFSGRRLVALLEARGDEVHTLGTRDLARRRHHRVADPLDRAALGEVVARVGPDQVFHLAGLTAGSDPLEYYRVNLGFGAALLSALEGAGHAACPTLVVGTSAEYGQVTAAELPILESLAARPYGHYGISKLAQTVEALAAARRGRPVVIARPFNLAGAGMPGHLVVAAFARQLAEVVKGRRSAVIEVGNLDASRDFLHVDDAVASYRALLGEPKAYGQIVNVCSGVGVTVRAILETLIRLAGVAVEVRTSAGLVKQIDIPEHYGSVARLHQLIGPLRSRSFEATLREVLDDALERP